MRSHSLRSTAMLTGFISLEEVRSPSPPSSSSSSSSSDATRTRRSMFSSFTRPKWVYAVLHQGKLRCYRRRVDIKLNREPSRVVLLDLQATLVGERQSLLVQSRATGKTLRLRVHASSTTTYLQWLTALYLARLDASGGLTPDTTGKKTKATTTMAKPVKTKARRKRVTFNEEPSEYHFDGEDDVVDPSGRETVDLGELFYSRADLAAFRASHLKDAQDDKAPLRVGRKIVRSLVAKLRRKGSSESDDDEAE